MKWDEKKFSLSFKSFILQIEDVFINKDERKCENYTSLYTQKILLLEYIIY